MLYVKVVAGCLMGFLCKASEREKTDYCTIPYFVFNECNDAQFCMNSYECICATYRQRNMHFN